MTLTEKTYPGYTNGGSLERKRLIDLPDGSKQQSYVPYEKTTSPTQPLWSTHSPHGKAYGLFFPVLSVITFPHFT